MDIDYADLTTAFQGTNTFDHSYWFNTETGDVLMIDDWSEGQACELDSRYDPNRFDTSHPLSYNRGQQVRPGR